MNPLRQRTQALAQALATRLTADQLAELRHDLTEHWTDGDLIASNAPGGADVMLYALEDACATATENDPIRSTGPVTHASPACACGTNEAGQRYRDPICRTSSTLPTEHPQTRTRLPSDVDQGPEASTEAAAGIGSPRRAILREQLAAIEHERWSAWQRWMHEQCARQADGSLLIPAELVQRWDRQAATPYGELSEREQASDLAQVDRYWPLIAAITGEWAEHHAPYDRIVSTLVRTLRAEGFVQ